ncbi:sigma-70 family RNA polymerase sigma factor [Caenimonas sedimenti]|uniref:Sigma-70 family RNA polymerase sigma factor n=1 Tax=Caenimonas sedimenti TaxID=2596921 RepID=A0A562ZJX3_9BURK|nr:sigma-70 family RNA polymerase sigma factor [Caenimonas sedimenti]TWO68889.1 sigma-70 family RNA polymerase sigma factor [Caenimonas sedimenti]
MSGDPTNLQTLLAQTARGDHRAFEEVYRRTHAHLFGLALRMLGREQAAEDVLQEAFVSIWKSASLYRTQVEGQEIQPMTWLIAIVRNKALDALRARTRRRESELPEPGEADEDEGAFGGDAAPSALELFAQATRALRLEDCLSELDGSHRQSLALAYYQGLSHSEVASQMGAPLGSVKAWIRRGLDKLKSCLQAAGTA